jgi:hypothetical protein
MNINRALTVLAKKFAVNSDIFKSLSKETVISWGEQVEVGNLAEKRTGDNTYLLTRHQHAFLTGDFNFIPVNAKNSFVF